MLAGLTPRAKQIDGMGFGGKPVWEFEDRVGLLKGLNGLGLLPLLRPQGQAAALSADEHRHVLRRQRLPPQA